jgi:hypothetical protein
MRDSGRSPERTSWSLCHNYKPSRDAKSYRSILEPQHLRRDSTSSFFKLKILARACRGSLTSIVLTAEDEKTAQSNRQALLIGVTRINNFIYFKREGINKTFF